MPSSMMAAVGLTEDDHAASRRFLDDFHSVYTYMDPAGAGIPASKLNLSDPEVKAQHQKAKVPYADKITLKSAAKVLLPIHRENIKKYVAAGYFPNITVKAHPDYRLAKRDDCNTKNVEQDLDNLGLADKVATARTENNALGFGWCGNFLLFASCTECGYAEGKEGQSSSCE
ncbi:hypothetical protein HDV00_005330 [Rhizophlyctis rosea]|nr:hypothetical protein HDV00_005330 [Rhizophlyctis rosea]